MYVLGWNSELQCYGILDTLDIWVIQQLTVNDKLKVYIDCTWYDVVVSKDTEGWFLQSGSLCFRDFSHAEVKLR